MKIQVNTDRTVSGGETLTNHVEDQLRRILDRFSDDITRVEVHLTEENNAGDPELRDKHCMLEVRLAGQQPVAVNDDGQTIEQAVSGAAKKMVGLLESDMGRRGKH